MRLAAAVGLILLVYLYVTYASIYNFIGYKKLINPNQTYYTFENHSSKPERKQSYFTYVAIGDSLTAGVGAENPESTYPYSVARNLNKHQPVRLVNVGQPGVMTGELEYQIRLAIEEKPEIITVLIGVNDIHNKVSFEQFKLDYEALLDQLDTRTEAKIYVLTLPYIASPKLFMPPWNILLNIKTKQFNKGIKEIASKRLIPVIDLYTLTEGILVQMPDYYSSDLFHPSGKGYIYWGNLIYENIDR